VEESLQVRRNENTAPMWLVVVAQNAICSFEEKEEEEENQ